MNIEEFTQLFRTEVLQAAKNYETFKNTKVPYEFLIELHGTGYREPRVLGVDQAAEELYIGENLFYEIIDLSVKEVKDEETILFVRASGHNPVPWSETYSGNKGTGPFKQMIVSPQDQE